MKKRTLKNLFALAVSLLLAGMVVACNTADDDDDDKGHSFSRVTYDANGGYFLVSYSVDEEDDFEIEEETYSTSEPNGIYWVGVASRHVKGPERTGYTLIGYTLNKDGTGTVYDKVNDRLQLTSDITLYAKWERDESVDLYTITFNANGGTGEMADQEIATTEEYFYLRGTSFSREGYVFTGWNTESDGTGTFFSANTDISTETLFGDDRSDITLYAQWISTAPAETEADDIYSGVTQANIADTLATAAKSEATSITLKMKGDLNDSFFTMVKNALNANDSVQVMIDLSECTGITIPEYALGGFKDGSLSLVAVTLPSSVTNIKEGAFAYCRNLVSVNIPDGVTDIGRYAFMYCDSLESIDIPNTLTTIEERAFYNCASLTSITFPASVTTIENQAFAYTALTSLSIPCTVTSLAAGAFYNCPITDLVYDCETVSFQDSLLHACPLENLVIGDHITELGENWGMIAHPKNLITATIGNGVTDIGTFFTSCTLLESVSIGNSVTTIGEYAFGFCSALKEIIVPDNVTNIGKGAFTSCKSLKSITIGKGVTSIGESAFYDAKAIEKVIYTGTLEQWCNISFGDTLSSPFHDSHASLYLEDDLLTNMVIPDTVTEIKQFAFDSCQSLTSVSIPDSVTNIGLSAFGQCTSLESVVIIGNGMTTIGASAFHTCSSLKNVIIGNGVTIIERQAFYDCPSLESVTIGNSVETIEREAFYKCDAVKKVIFTGTLEQWCNISFDSASNPCSYARDLYLEDNLLTNAVIPDTMTEIKSETFTYCQSLTTVTIPKSVTTIGYDAFHYCTLVNYCGSEDDWKKINGYSAITDISINYNYTGD